MQKVQGPRFGFLKPDYINKIKPCEQSSNKLLFLIMLKTNVFNNNNR